MKILYDHQAFDIQKSGGVSNVFSLLVEEVHKRADTALGMASTNNLYLLSNGFPSRENLLTSLKERGLVSEETKVEDVDWTKINRAN